MANLSDQILRGRTWPRRRVNFLALFAAAVFVLLLAPTVVVAIISFSSSRYLQFPPPGFSFQWYTAFFGDAGLRRTMGTSVRIGILSTLLSVMIGTLTAFVLTRYSLRGKAVMRLVILGPLVVPYIVQAVGLFKIFLVLGLRGTVFSIILAHTVISVPYVVLVVSAGLQAVPKSLEEAARVLGAKKFTATVRITFPLIKASIAASAVFAFIASWDEFIMAYFLSGVTTETLPVRMFMVLRDSIDPRLTAISTLLIVFNFLLVILFSRFTARSRSILRTESTG